MRRFSALCALVLAGCGGGDPPIVPPLPDAGACGSGVGTAVPGTGTTRFRAFGATGGELEIVRGSQGGIHVLVAFRPVDMDLTRVAVSYALLEPSTEIEIAPPVARSLDTSGFTRDTEGYVRLGDLLVLDNMVPRVEDFVGRSARFRLDVISADGTHACPESLVMLIDRE